MTALRADDAAAAQPSETAALYPSKTVWTVMALGFFAIVFEGYDLVVYGACVPALLAEPGWGLTPPQVGLIGSAALLGMFAGAPFAGWLADRFGRRLVFIGLLTLFSIMMIAAAYAPTPQTLGLARFFAGLGFGGLPPTVAALIVEFAPPKRKVLFSAITFTSFGFGGILAGALAFNLIDKIGFRGLFAFGGLPLVTLIPLVYWLLPESPSFRKSSGAPGTPGQSFNPWDGVIRGGALPATTLFSLANLFSFLMVFGVLTWIPQLMRGAGLGAAAAIFLPVFSLGGIIGALSGGWAADRFGARRVVTAQYLICALSLGLLTVSAPLPVTGLLMFIAGAAANQSVLFTYVATHYGPQSRATAGGVTQGIGRLGAGAGPLLGGLLVGAGAGFGGNVALFAAAAVCAAIAAFLVPRPAPMASKTAG